MSDSLFKSPNFRLHWASVAISQIGSFFTTVALPWLVLSKSHDDPMVVTSVIAANTLPNGFFILFGGALADRFSPFKTLVLGRSVFILVMASLAVLTYSSQLPLWAIYSYAVVLGILGAIGIPASQSLLPLFLPSNQLGLANGVVMGTLQVAQMLGPVAAGWLIWFGRHLSGVPAGDADSASIAFAFAADATAVAASVVLMSFMKVGSKPSGKIKMLTLMLEGIRYSWRESGTRLVLGYLILVSFFLQGPLIAVLPIFTKLTLGLYERTFGALYAMIGLGTILGVGIAMVTRPSAKNLGAVVLCCDFIIGTAFYSLGHTQSWLVSGVLLLVMGMGLGVTMVAGTTWFQTRTPGKYMGRMMSLVMFAVQGLVPISAIVTGYLMEKWPLGLVINGAGLLIMFFSGAGLMIPRVRRMGDLPTGVSIEDPVTSSA